LPVENSCIEFFETEISGLKKPWFDLGFFGVRSICSETSRPRTRTFYRNIFMTTAIDALILAGDKEGYVSVHHRNKAFLSLKGKCLLEHVIKAVDRTQHVRNIFVVGPLDTLTSSINLSDYQKPVEFLPQSTSVIDNILTSYETIYSWDADYPLLILPSDIPLTTPSEIDAFITGADYFKYDYVMGFQTEKALRAFYPTETHDGIRMSYFYFKQFIGRHNNLHIVWPNRVKNVKLVNTTYNLRYQKKFQNYLKWVASIVPSTKGKGKILRLTLLMQLALIGDYMGVDRISKSLRPLMDIREIEACISNALRIRFRVYCMDFGASAVDIDSEKDLEIISERFDSWKNDR